jgi:hypothetical protein
MSTAVTPLAYKTTHAKQETTRSSSTTFFDRLDELNSSEKFRTAKGVTKLVNRIIKTGAITISDNLLPIAQVTKFVREMVLTIRSISTLHKAEKSVKFIVQTQKAIEKDPNTSIVIEGIKNFFNSIMFGGCEERRRLVKNGLSMVMLPSIAIYLAAQAGVLETICQQALGQTEGAQYAMMLLAVSEEAVKIWQICRRLEFAHTLLHQMIIASPQTDTVKKSQKRNFSLIKAGLLLARYGFKWTEFDIPERLAAIGAAALPFIKFRKEKAKKNDKEDSQEITSPEIKKKDKKEKLEKAKAPLKGRVGFADNTARAMITILICLQLYFFMNLLLHPFENSHRS